MKSIPVQRVQSPRVRLGQGVVDENGRAMERLGLRRLVRDGKNAWHHPGIDVNVLS